jgi:hypothetical protein
MMCILFFFLSLKSSALTILIVQGVVYFVCLEGKVYIAQIPRSKCNISMVKLMLLHS